VVGFLSSQEARASTARRDEFAAVLRQDVAPGDLLHSSSGQSRCPRTCTLTAHRTLMHMRVGRSTNGRQAALHPRGRHDASRVLRALPAPEPTLHGHGMRRDVARRLSLELLGGVLRILRTRRAAGDRGAAGGPSFPGAAVPGCARANAALRAIRSPELRRLSVVRHKCAATCM